jgi:hypothetical protein
MSSVGDQILDAIVELLDDPAKPAGLTADRFRVQKIVPPAAAVYGISEEVSQTQRGQGLVHRRKVVRVDCRAEGEVPDQAVDPILTWVTKQLIANQQLGGLALGIIELRTEWKADLGGKVPLGVAWRDFAINYQTLGADPEAKHG